MEKRLASVYFRMCSVAENKSLQCNSESLVLVQEYIQWNRKQTSLYKFILQFPVFDFNCEKLKNAYPCFPQAQIPNKANFFFPYSLHDKRKRKFHLRILSTTYMLFYINCATFSPLSACFKLSNGLWCGVVYVLRQTWSQSGCESWRGANLVGSILVLEFSSLLFYSYNYKSIALRIHSDSDIAWFPTRKGIS